MDYTHNTHRTFMGMTHLSRNLTDAKKLIYMYIASVYEHSLTRSFLTAVSQQILLSQVRCVAYSCIVLIREYGT